MTARQGEREIGQSARENVDMSAFYSEQKRATKFERQKLTHSVQSKNRGNVRFHPKR